jgi:CRISPR-associated protein Cmr6
MTPHQSHYYQRGETPHESGSPNPINFLTVPPGSEFAFHVQCNRPFLARIAPGLAKDDRWKALLEAAFVHAFAWLGFGAKTAVGYGAMRPPTKDELATQEKERVARATAAQRCNWVDEKISELVKKNNAKPGDVVRGKALAEAWKELADASLKEWALADIRARWKKEGWWDRPPGGAAKQARAIYEGKA